jgi:hypothetical protein
MLAAPFAGGPKLRWNAVRNKPIGDAAETPSPLWVMAVN